MDGGKSRAPVRDRPVRVALVGAGAFGRLHAQAFAARDDVELVSVVDTDGIRANGLAAEVDARAHTSLTNALDADALDAVSVVVGGPARVGLTRAALVAGCSVLVEKPVALSAGQARGLAELEAISPGFVMPAHILRFAEPYRRVHRGVHAGDIGTPTDLKFHRHRGEDHDRRFPDIHPVLMTMVHDIDLAVWFDDNPLPVGDAAILATEQRVGDRAQPVAVAASITWPGRARWEFDISWRLRPGEERHDSLQVTGAEGMMSLDLGDLASAGVAGVGPDSAWLTPVDGGGALGAEVAEFVGAVQAGKPPATVTLADAVRGLEIADAVVAAARATRSNSVGA